MKAPWRPKDVAEDDLTLNTSQNAWRKWQTQYKSSTRKKAANTVMWSSTSNKPILQTLLFNFSQPPLNHSDVWIDRTSHYPQERKNWHVDERREENTGIKGEESQEKGGDRRKLQKEEWEECDASQTKSEESNSSGYIDVRLSYLGQTYLCMSSHEIRTKSRSGN